MAQSERMKDRRECIKSQFCGADCGFGMGSRQRLRHGSPAHPHFQRIGQLRFFLALQPRAGGKGFGAPISYRPSDRRIWPSVLYGPGVDGSRRMDSRNSLTALSRSPLCLSAIPSM